MFQNSVTNKHLSHQTKCILPICVALLRPKVNSVSLVIMPSLDNMYMVGGTCMIDRNCLTLALEELMDEGFNHGGRNEKNASSF